MWGGNFPFIRLSAHVSGLLSPCDSSLRSTFSLTLLCKSRAVDTSEAPSNPIRGCGS